MHGDGLPGWSSQLSGGRRSTSALGSAVVADALRQADPAGALAAEQDANWRAGYLVHFRGSSNPGCASRDAAVSVARDGLESLHRRMGSCTRR